MSGRTGNNNLGLAAFIFVILFAIEIVISMFFGASTHTVIKHDDDVIKQIRGGLNVAQIDNELMRIDEKVQQAQFGWRHETKGDETKITDMRSDSVVYTSKGNLKGDELKRVVSGLRAQGKIGKGWHTRLLRNGVYYDNNDVILEETGWSERATINNLTRDNAKVRIKKSRGSKRVYLNQYKKTEVINLDTNKVVFTKDGDHTDCGEKHIAQLIEQGALTEGYTATYNKGVTSTVIFSEGSDDEEWSYPSHLDQSGVNKLIREKRIGFLDRSQYNVYTTKEAPPLDTWNWIFASVLIPLTLMILTLFIYRIACNVMGGDDESGKNKINVKEVCEEAGDSKVALTVGLFQNVNILIGAAITETALVIVWSVPHIIHWLISQGVKITVAMFWPIVGIIAVVAVLVGVYLYFKYRAHTKGIDAQMEINRMNYEMTMANLALPTAERMDIPALVAPGSFQGNGEEVVKKLLNAPKKIKEPKD